MLTRRGFVTGLIATGVLARRPDTFAKASQPTTSVDFDIPLHACDSHTHIYGDLKRFPLSPQHVNTPEPALPAEMSRLHRALHIERVVIVTAGAYGTDNSAMLYGIKARGATARGVAVIVEQTPESDLDSMDRAGVRGIRILPGAARPTDLAGARERFQASVNRVQRRNWHVQMNTSLAVISGIKDLVLASSVASIFDHFGGTRAALGLDQPGFVDLLELVRSGSAYVKLSGAYHVSTQAPDYPDVVPFAKALIAANPNRILWGTDWPHPNNSTPVSGRKPTDVMPLYPIDDGRLLNQLAVWAPEPAIRKMILVDNPASLYGF